jgi:hypothetical protein
MARFLPIWHPKTEKIHINRDCTASKSYVPLQRISKNALRVKAAAQYSSNKLDSAFLD